MSTREPDPETSEPREDPEELAREVVDENPDPTTRREAFELGLMENDESEAGEEISVVSDSETEPPRERHHRPSEGSR
jgi:hypothetical protein